MSTSGNHYRETKKPRRIAPPGAKRNPKKKDRRSGYSDGRRGSDVNFIGM